MAHEMTKGMRRQTNLADESPEYLAVVAAAEPIELRAHGRARGWDRLRLLSAGSNTFKYDFGSEDREGNQDSTV